MPNTFVADPAIASRGSMLVNQIEVDQKPLPVSENSLMEVRIEQRGGSHETAIITTKLEASQVDTMKDKTIAFTYGNRSNLGTFYGYVYRVRASKSYQQDGVYDIECYGPTGTMQSGSPKFFLDRTVPQIVAEVVKEHRLGVQVDAHSFVFPTLAQTDDTDWGFISSIASLLGWTLYTHNSVVRLVDPLRILNETGPILRLIRGNDALDKTRQLMDFTPSSKSLNLASMITPVFGFFDKTKASITHELDQKHRLYTDSPILNRAMADVARKAWDSNPTSWTQKAGGRLQGSPSIITGTTVSIQSSGSSVVQHDYDGVWLVNAVTHVLTNKSFQTYIEVARTDDKPTKTNTEYKPYWTLGTQGRPQVVRRNEVWESSWKTVSTVSSRLTPETLTTSNHEWKPA